MRVAIVVWHSDVKVPVEEGRQLHHTVCADKLPDIPGHPALDVFEQTIGQELPDPRSTAWRFTGFRRVGGVTAVRIKKADFERIVAVVEDAVAHCGLVCYVKSFRSYVWQPPYLRLNRGFWSPIENPGPIAIERLFGQLRPQQGSHVILSRRSEVYMQVAMLLQEEGDPAPTEYMLEYREGGADRHYQIITPDADGVVKALLSYALDDDKWRSMFAYHKMDL